jgi:hypothetical protein
MSTTADSLPHACSQHANTAGVCMICGFDPSRPPLPTWGDYEGPAQQPDADRQRAAFMAGFTKAATVWTKHHPLGIELAAENAYTAWLATQPKETK